MMRRNATMKVSAPRPRRITTRTRGRRAFAHVKPADKPASPAAKKAGEMVRGEQDGQHDENVTTTESAGPGRSTRTEEYISSTGSVSDYRSAVGRVSMSG